MNKLNAFAKKFPTRSYQAKEIILHQDDKVRCGYFILSGKVRVYDINNLGEEKPLSYDKQDEIFPITYLYLGTRHSPYYYEAYTDCKLAIIPKKNYLEFIKSNPDVLFITTKALVARYSDFNRRINALTQLKAENKVLHALKYFSRRHGDRKVRGKTLINIPLSQQELANFAGLTRETVSSVMSKLKKRKIVSYDSNKPMKVDKDKINKDLDK